MLRDGFAKLWETDKKHLVVQTTDSVAFLILVTDLNQVLLTHQYRPATLDPEDSSNGMITEVTAGRFDAKLTVEELIAQEASEEAGATISSDQVILLNDGRPVYLSPGIITEKQVLAVVVVDSKQIEDTEKVFGVASEGEQITRVWMAVDKFIDGPHQDMKTFALATWLKANKNDLPKI